MGTTAEKLQAIVTSKADIAAAITEKGGTAPQKLSEFGNAIRALPSGGAEITHKKSVEVIAQNQITVGDTVYTIGKDKSPVLRDNNGMPNTSATYAAAFSPDGSLLVIGGAFAYRAKIYRVNGSQLTYINAIYADTHYTILDAAVSAVTFSPDGKLLVLGGQFSGYAKVYSVNGEKITYLRDIKRGSTAPNSSVNAVTFSPDGTLLVLGGNFTGRAFACSVSGTQFTYLGDLYADSGTTALSAGCYCAAFSPDGTLLVLGGNFSGMAKVYSVTGTSIAYLSNIYANAGTTALNKAVRDIAFAPNGALLVLTGDFTRYAKAYTVDGGTITYLGDIYANAGTTALSNPGQCATFSPDGTLLILGGQFTGRGKYYSVDGTQYTYLGDIYADAGTTALNAGVNIAAFSPNGMLLVLGGAFAGYAKSYQVDMVATPPIKYVPANKDSAYAIDTYQLPLSATYIGSVLPIGIGYATAAAAEGEEATVEIIFEIT